MHGAPLICKCNWQDDNSLVCANGSGLFVEWTPGNGMWSGFEFRLCRCAADSVEFLPV